MSKCFNSPQGHRPVFAYWNEDEHFCVCVPEDPDPKHGWKCPDK